MRRVAIRGLVWRRMRSILTALAVVLGVAMVSGTFILTDTIKKAFNDIFDSSYKNTSAVISGREIVKNSASGDSTIRQSLLPRVKQLPGVAAAAGAIADVSSNGNTTKLLDRNGKAISNGGASTLGLGIDSSQPRFNPLNLTEGHWASGPDQMVIDAATASSHHFKVGSVVSVAARGPVRRMTVTGLAKYGNVSSLGGVTFAVFDIPTAQVLLGKQGQLDSISLAAKPGVSENQLVREVRPLLPPTATVQSAAQKAAADSKDVNKFINFIQYFMLAFGVIALFVGAFVIVNTLSITVAQRSREFATLRTIGATRRQVRRSVVLEGFVLGILASITGLVLGLALAQGLHALFKALSLDLPTSGTILRTRTITVSLILGTMITVIASLIPAIRATRVPPIAAVREGAVLPTTRLSPLSGPMALVLTVAAIAALVLGSFGNAGTGPTLLLLGVGVLALFVGVALIAKRIVRPLAALIGAPGARLGGAAGRLARGNATRNPARTASTAAALMIGLALVTLVAVLGQGLRTSDRNALSSQVRADYVLTSRNGFDQFSPDAVRRLPAIPGVGLASPIFDDRARVFGKDTTVEGIDPRTMAQTYNLHITAGSLAALGPSGAIVKKDYAKDHSLRVGSPFTITTPAGKRLSLRVSAISSPPVFDKIDAILGNVSINAGTFVANFPRPKVMLALLKVNGGATSANTALLKQAVASFPDAKLQTKSQWVTTRSNGINKLLNLLYVLLALSVVVSLFGMVNTLVLAIFERTRELGMLRAVGMTRRQVRTMIRQESVITALIGAALGLPVGIFLAALVTRALSDQGLTFALPILWLVAFAAVAAVLGVFAAVFPARRAARLNVLEALQYE
jgi:putative ABC transport system permease protein